MTEYEPVTKNGTENPDPAWCTTHETVTWANADRCYGHRLDDPPCQIKTLYVEKDERCKATFTFDLGAPKDHVTVACHLEYDHDVHTAYWMPNGVGETPMVEARWRDDD